MPPIKSGDIQVGEEKQTLTHTVFISLFPNWAGQTQPRVIKIEENLLHLSTASFIILGGKTVNPFLLETG
jgi:hypothetical protein